jgi:tRNA threonylcarbamoyladenosine biosynthesis protein TsaB
MLLLAVSTSSARGTVAVVRGDALLARVAYDGGTSHAERLFGALDEALARAGVSRADLGAIACDVGPGSFTGVRVGVAACQGISLALGVPAVGVGALEAMCRGARDAGFTSAVVAVLDARKGEVFAAIHDAAGATLWGPVHLPRDESPAIEAARLGLAPDAVVVGEVATTLVGLPPPLRGDALDLPDAEAVAREALDRLARGDAAGHDPALLSPLYVRAPDAKPSADGGSSGAPV